MKWNNKYFETADELTKFLNEKSDELCIKINTIHITEFSPHGTHFTLFYFGLPAPII